MTFICSYCIFVIIFFFILYDRKVIISLPYDLLLKLRLLSDWTFFERNEKLTSANFAINRSALYYYIYRILINVIQYSSKNEGESRTSRKFSVGKKEVILF
jgi:hypothetical protein